jgi:hypothetical protein
MEPHWHTGITLSTRTEINTLHFADDQVIITDLEDNIHRGVCTLQNIAKKNLEWKYHQKNLR